jgi:hypothetical protein
MKNYPMKSDKAPSKPAPAPAKPAPGKLGTKAPGGLKKK